jgi:hypothetical protein
MEHTGGVDRWAYDPPNGGRGYPLVAPALWRSAPHSDRRSQQPPWSDVALASSCRRGWVRVSVCAIVRLIPRVGAPFGRTRARERRRSHCPACRGVSVSPQEHVFAANAGVSACGLLHIRQVCVGRVNRRRTREQLVEKLPCRRLGAFPSPAHAPVRGEILLKSGQRARRQSLR